jgi:twitching motility protein PilT
MQEVAKSFLPEKQFLRLEGRHDIDFSSTSGNGLRFRGHAYYVQGHLNFAFRFLPLEIPKTAALGIPQTLVNFLKDKTEGLFLVTGPTGSGKSTTLASLIDSINETSALHIVTIEDPVEYVYTNKKSLVKQREVGKDDGDVHTFPDALRSALREDPDIIFVGEMRDPETIRLALRAAETGHLVFSTLHTGYASQIPNRIVNAFPASEQEQIRGQLAHVLYGAIAQRLHVRKDGSGRVAAFEIMLVSDAIRNLILEGKLQGIRDSMKTSRKEGMILLEDAIHALKEEGII